MEQPVTTTEREDARRTPGATVLFVCTGNTCRSPMAAAIAERLVLDAGQRLRHVHALSAGVSAAPGAPMTPEAEQSLRRMGVEPPSHRSTPLTAEMLQQATAVFAMTRHHAEAAARLAPDAMERIHTLDPGGDDIPDPIGQSQGVYDATAQRLRDLIAARLEDLA